MATTPLRSIRIPDDLWGALQEKTDNLDGGASAVIRKLIADWLKKN